MDVPLAQRRPRRQDRQLPLRFRDDPLPQALPPAILSADTQAEPSETHIGPGLMLEAPEPTQSPAGSALEQPFTTNRNIFGLFRRFFGSTPPSHDPEEFISLQELSEEHISENDSKAPQANAEPNSGMAPVFYPYPNDNAFQLGDWYWSGAQKSHESFKRLIKIVGSPAFRPEDVRDVPWKKIDNILASDSTEVEWMDEVAGWKRTPIKISVPFHKRTGSPGPKDYVAGELFHRPLVSVLREKLSNPEHAQGFHYEPFELFWQPGNQSTKTRVHGELYTSRAFARAHRELMNSEMEAGCTLPRAIAAMMFWSDATLLTSFGDAKLWPCYLFFGNETKYRRCKPSCNLCSHVAYFQVVREICTFKRL